MVVKTKRKSQVASRKYKTLKGGSNIPKQGLKVPSAFGRINNSIAYKKAQNPRFGFLKNKFYNKDKLRLKKTEISAPTNLKMISTANSLSGHFNGSKFYFHKNNQPSQVKMVQETEYNPVEHRLGGTPTRFTGKMIENEV
jgi:hypothetical protein